VTVAVAKTLTATRTASLVESPIAPACYRRRNRHRCRRQRR
jgi:hypothetical protein